MESSSPSTKHPLNPETFVASQFFLLSLMFAAFFDPIGISYAMLGIVWVMNKKLAYFEAGLILFFKGFYGYALTSNGWLNLEQFPVWAITPMRIILPIEILLAGYYGATLAIKLSGKILRLQIEKKAPDLLGLIRK